MFAFNTYTTHKWLALLMKYHCGINSCFVFFPFLIKFTRKPAIPARSCVFSISKTDMHWNKWVSNPTQFPFFSPAEEHTARWEQQRSSVVNKVVNQWSQWLGDLGKQQHWHVQPTNSPHFSSRLFCFSFWSSCLIINDQTSSVLLDFFWDSSEASRNLLIASLLPKCFWTDFSLPPKRTKTTKSHWFSSTSFPHLNPLLHCYTVFLDHSPTLLLLLSFSPLHLGILLWLLQVPSGWQTVVVSSLEESR